MNLDALELAISAYKQRFDIEEMVRDFKKGGYNLEDTNLTGEQFISLVCLIAICLQQRFAIAYSSTTIQGQQIKGKGIQKYISRLKEHGRTERRHSSFHSSFYLDKIQILIVKLLWGGHPAGHTVPHLDEICCISAYMVKLGSISRMLVWI